LTETLGAGHAACAVDVADLPSVEALVAAQRTPIDTLKRP
jgi:hypothetical protein